MTIVLLRTVKPYQVVTMRDYFTGSEVWSPDDMHFVNWFVEAFESDSLPNQSRGPLMPSIPGNSRDTTGRFRLTRWNQVSDLDLFYSCLLKDCNKSGPSRGIVQNQLRHLRARSLRWPFRTGDW